MKKISTDKNGKTTCTCSDGITYTNCGNACECCRNVSKKVDSSSSSAKWMTISCPCSSYAIINSVGDIECEMDFLGDKHRLKPVTLRNHSISNRQPKVRDKWDCGGSSGIHCGQGSIKWDSLHVVQVKANVNAVKVALYNSKASNLNCYIPPTTLVDYTMGDTSSDYDYSDINGVDITNPIDTIDGFPLFEDEEQAMWFNYFKGTKTISNQTSEYLSSDGVTMYFPGVYYPNKKLITGVFIEGHDIIQKNLKANWNYKSYSSEPGKLEVGAAGGLVKVKILGKKKPMVDITIKNSSNRSVLRRKLQNIIIDREFVLEQQIPSLPPGKTKEAYSVEITPSADTSYYLEEAPENDASRLIKSGTLKYTIWQYAGSKMTITQSASTIPGTTTTGSPVSVTGVVGRVDNATGLEHTFTLSRSEGTYNYYINNSINLEDLLVSDSIIKKVLERKDNGDTSKCLTEFEVSDHSEIGGDIEVGMLFSGRVKKVKTILGSVDLEAKSNEPCDEQGGGQTHTNQFQLDNTIGLIKGMIVTGVGQNGKEFDSILLSIDSDIMITLSNHYTIDNGTELTFDWRSGGTVYSIVNDRILCGGCVQLPRGTLLNFTTSNAPSIKGNIAFSNFGGDSMKVVTTISSIKYGQGNHTYTLDPDLFITKNPSAHDQHVETTEGQAITIDFFKNDRDFNKKNKTLTITSQPNKSKLTDSVRGTEGYLIYTPPTNFIGSDKAKFTTSDGVTVSEEKTIFITIK